MACISLDDLVKAITLSTVIQLSNDTPGATTPNLTNLNDCIDRAENLAYGYAKGTGITVPFAPPVPPLFKNWVLELALYNLRTRRTEGKGNETLETKRKETIRQLEQFQAGKISLGIESDAVGFQAATIKVNKTSEDRMFSKDVLNQY